MPKIIIKYDQTGAMEMDGQGFKGAACETATKKFLSARANATVTDDKKKPEYFQANTSGVGLQNKL